MEEVYQVVTGAFNLKEGDKIPLALPGAKLIDGHKLVMSRPPEADRAPARIRANCPTSRSRPERCAGVESTAVAVAALELGIRRILMVSWS